MESSGGVPWSLTLLLAVATALAGYYGPWRLRLAFLIDGHMVVSASSGGGLLRRIDPAETNSLVDEPHVRPFESRERCGAMRFSVEVRDTSLPLPASQPMREVA